MDTSNFNSQARQHLGVYKNFMTFSMVSVAVIAVVLILMALFLL